MMFNLSGPAPSEARAAIGPADHWCPSDQQATFDTRAKAENLIEVPFLKSTGLTGQGVNVVIIDQGLNKERLGSEVEGWLVGSIAPGATALEPAKPHGGHGMLVAANVLSVAPHAKLFDLPMLPKTKIEDVTKFFNDIANDAYRPVSSRVNSGCSVFMPAVSSHSCDQRDRSRPDSSLSTPSRSASVVLPYSYRRK